LVSKACFWTDICKYALKDSGTLGPSVAYTSDPGPERYSWLRDA